MKIFRSFILLTIILSPSIHADQIIIAAEDDWDPYAKANGTGMANEIVTRAFKKVDVGITFEVLPYPRVLKYVKSSQFIAGFNVPLDDESKENFLLSKSPLFYAKFSFYHNPASNKKNSDPPLLGLVSDYGYGDKITKMLKKNLFSAHYTQSDKQLVKMLERGRLDKILIYNRVAKKLLSKESKIEKDKTFQSYHIPIYLAFSKDHLHSQKYRDLFEKGLTQLKEAGTYKEILESYQHNAETKP